MPQRRQASNNQRGLDQMQNDFYSELQGSAQSSPSYGDVEDPMGVIRSIIKKETGKDVSTQQLPGSIMDLIAMLRGGGGLDAFPVGKTAVHRPFGSGEPIESVADIISHEAEHMGQGSTGLAELMMPYFEQPREQGAFLAEQRRGEARRAKRGEKMYQYTLPPRLK